MFIVEKEPDNWEYDLVAVNFRFDSSHYLNEFVTTGNYDVEKVAENCQNLDGVINYNYSKIKYPLDIFGNPLTSGFFAYGLRLLKPLYMRAKQYIWLFPYETIYTGYGICVDTTNLVQALLENLLVDSFAVLGEVRKSDSNALLGYHAWVELETDIVETTIHKGQGDYKNIVIPKDLAYSGKLKLKYVPMIVYNSRVTMTRKDKKLQLFFWGLNSPFKSFRDYVKAEIIKQKHIWSLKIEEKEEEQ